MASTYSAEPADVSSRSRKRIRIRYLPRPMIVGGLILAVYLFVALTGPLWVPYGPAKVGVGPPYAPPAPEYIFGTDKVGRDVLTRTVFATRLVLAMSFGSTLAAILVGGFLGLLSGLVRGWLDDILNRIFEVLISIPVIIFALLVIASLPTELTGKPVLLAGVIAFVYFPRVARMARATALNLVTLDFITVARARGESLWSIVWRELAPNATGVLLVEFGVRAGQAPLFVGGLGFLGLGVRPPIAEWGVMISANRDAIIVSPIVVLAPAIALSVLVIGLNLFTDGLARVLGRTADRSVV